MKLKPTCNQCMARSQVLPAFTNAVKTLTESLYFPMICGPCIHIATEKIYINLVDKTKVQNRYDNLSEAYN